jgi:N-acetyl-anhydromuramyl-L-alanine amidase AmpD
LNWYRKKGAVHYLIGPGGLIYQMLPDNKRGAHVGIGVLERRMYLNGRWKRHVTAEALHLWQKRWPGFKSPQHLYPTRSPNSCYIGVEMIPLPCQRDNGLWFTDAQHVAVGELYADLDRRHGWYSILPEMMAYNLANTHLVGHEDIDARLSPGEGRWDNHGGWDPGALRARPRFDWQRVLNAIR